MQKIEASLRWPPGGEIWGVWEQSRPRRKGSPIGKKLRL